MPIRLPATLWSTLLSSGVLFRTITIPDSDIFRRFFIEHNFAEDSLNLVNLELGTKEIVLPLVYKFSSDISKSFSSKQLPFPRYLLLPGPFPENPRGGCDVMLIPADQQQFVKPSDLQPVWHHVQSRLDTLHSSFSRSLCLGLGIMKKKKNDTMPISIPWFRYRFQNNTFLIPEVLKPIWTISKIQFIFSSVQFRLFSIVLVIQIRSFLQIKFVEFPSFAVTSLSQILHLALFISTLMKRSHTFLWHDAYFHAKKSLRVSLAHASPVWKPRAKYLDLDTCMPKDYWLVNADSPS